MELRFFALNAAFIFAAMAAAAPVILSQTNENALINRFIAREAKKSGAVEYENPRKVGHGDLNGDLKSDLAVLYTIEGFGGGNAYAQYLAIFLASGKTFRFVTRSVVGGRFNRNMDLRSIAAGKINFDTMNFTKNDSACCPTLKGKTRLHPCER